MHNAQFLSIGYTKKLWYSYYTAPCDLNIVSFLVCEIAFIDINLMLLWSIHTTFVHYIWKTKLKTRVYKTQDLFFISKPNVLTPIFPIWRNKCHLFRRFSGLVPWCFWCRVPGRSASSSSARTPGSWWTVWCWSTTHLGSWPHAQHRSTDTEPEQNDQ